MQHISDDLPRLLTGDATREVVLQAAQHLRVCVDCQQELVSAVIAHASLTSAMRFAPEIVAPGTVDDTVEDDLDEASDGEALAPVIPLPDLSGLFADARAEAAPSTGPTTTTEDTADHTVVRASNRFRRGLVAVAAAAAVVVGGGVTYAAVSGDDGPTTRNVALAAYDVGTADASVKIVGDDTLKIDAAKLPKLDAHHQYEVWVTSDDRKRMQPIGFIGENNQAELAVPAKVRLSNYNAIEVSVQKADEATYSGTSVLRGTYG